MNITAIKPWNRVKLSVNSDQSLRIDIICSFLRTEMIRNDKIAIVISLLIVDINGRIVVIPHRHRVIDPARKKSTKHTKTSSKNHRIIAERKKEKNRETDRKDEFHYEGQCRAHPRWPSIHQLFLFIPWVFLFHSALFSLIFRAVYSVRSSHLLAKSNQRTANQQSTPHNSQSDRLDRHWSLSSLSILFQCVLVPLRKGLVTSSCGSIE